MIIKTILSVLAFIVFAPFAGAILTGITRKISARAQGRDGGDITQPISDCIALLQKGRGENSGIQGYYVKVSLFFNVLAGVLFYAGMDLLMTIACLGLGIIFMVIAASVSGTYYSRLGADRLAREMVAAAPMMFMVAIGFYVRCGSFDVKDLAMSGPVAFLPLLGLFAGYMLIPCGKLRRSSFEYRMPHAMYQKDMNSIADAFDRKDAAICEIGSWYEKTVLYSITYLFFANGTLLMTAVGVVCAVLTAVLQGIIENIEPAADGRRAFKSAWLWAFVIGIVNLVIIYIII